MEEDTDNPTWNKVIRDSEKAGYREGVEEGRNSVFQKYFDTGYDDGFNNAFQLARMKAAIRINKGIKDDPDLENTRRANCTLCNDPELENKPVASARKSQQEQTNKLLQNLFIRHSENSVIPLGNNKSLN